MVTESPEMTLLTVL